MPAALPVDWNEVRTLALSIGVAEAAKRMGISVDAAHQRSKREGWLAHRKAAQAALSPAARAQNLAIAHNVSSVSLPPTAAEILSKLGQNSRTKLAIAGDKAATRLSELDPDELITNETAQVAKAWSGTLSTTHGWAAKDQGDRPAHVINIAMMCHEPVEVTIQDSPVVEQ